MNETHYVAHIKVERVDTEKPDPPRSSGSGTWSSSTTTAAPVSRRVGEVTQLVVKAPTMAALKTRVAAHIDLIEDDVPMDETRRPGTR